MSAQMADVTPLYARAAAVYLKAGWAPLPLPADAKWPPPEGFTGRQGAYPDEAKVQQWAEAHADGNLGLRLPPGLVGIDVDAYGDKKGAQTLADLEAQLGPLPPTILSTARTDGISGIRIFRADERPSWRNPGPGIEVIHAGWRYVVAAPSVHPDTGQSYRWIDQATGEVVSGAPKTTRAAQLPDAWVDHMSSDNAVEKATQDVEAVNDWLAQADNGRPCTAMQNTLDRFHADMTTGARHDAALTGTVRIVRQIDRGHHGGHTALQAAADAFERAVVADRSRTPQTAKNEWDRILVGAWSIVQADPTPTDDIGCSCPSHIATLIYTKPDSHTETDQAASDDTDALQGWSAVDLSSIVDGELELDPPPEALARTDGQHLFYAGCVNALNGEPESGKTWVALEGIRQAIAAGNIAAFIDFESTAAKTVGRLMQLGLDGPQIAQGLRYIRPYGPLNEQRRSALLADCEGATLVVLDGVTEAMAMHSLSPLENDDVAKFYLLFPRPLAHQGAAVVLLDHVTKSKDQRGRWAFGAQHKMAGIDGAAYTVETITPMRRGHRGKSKIVVTKDRPGWVREYAHQGKSVAVAVVDDRDDVTLCELVPVEEDAAEREDAQLRRLWDYLARNEGMSKKTSYEGAKAAGIVSGNKAFYDLLEVLTAGDHPKVRVDYTTDGHLLYVTGETYDQIAMRLGDK